MSKIGAAVLEMPDCECACHVVDSEFCDNCMENHNLRLI